MLDIGWLDNSALALVKKGKRWRSPQLVEAFSSRSVAGFFEVFGYTCFRVAAWGELSGLESTGGLFSREFRMKGAVHRRLDESGA